MSEIAQVTPELAVASQPTEQTEISPRRATLREVYKTKPFTHEEFKSKLEKSGQEEADIIQNASKSENLIGSGGNATVFAIPGVEGYVVRIPHNGERKNSADLEILEDSFPDMNLGQAIAQLGNATILKEQKGIPAGVPHGEVRRNKGEGKNCLRIYLENCRRNATGSL